MREGPSEIQGSRGTGNIPTIVLLLPVHTVEGSYMPGITGNEFATGSWKIRQRLFPGILRPVD